MEHLCNPYLVAELQARFRELLHNTIDIGCILSIENCHLSTLEVFEVMKDFAETGLEIETERQQGWKVSND